MRIMNEMAEFYQDIEVIIIHLLGLAPAGCLAAPDNGPEGRYTGWCMPSTHIRISRQVATLVMMVSSHSLLILILRKFNPTIARAKLDEFGRALGAIC
jgi:hypothetical protein